MSRPKAPGTSPPSATDNASGPDPETAHEAVRQAMHERVDLARLPPPPASAIEWRERSIRLCHDMPGLRNELANLPIGWFPLVEYAVLEIRRRLLPGQFFHTRQLKEKFGTLRWYTHVTDGTDEFAADTGAEGAVDWAEDASARVCALLGTPDGHIDRTGGWLLTLSAEASAMRRESQASGIRSNFAALMYPRWGG